MPYRPSSGFSKLLSGAKKNRHLRARLLAEPRRIIRDGFDGKKYALTGKEKGIILRHHEHSLEKLSKFVMKEMLGLDDQDVIEP